MKSLLTLVAVALLASGCAHQQHQEKAQARKVEGIVKASYTVNEKGCAENVKILSAQPAGMFERDVISAMNKWCGLPPTTTPKKISLVFSPKDGIKMDVPQSISSWAQAVNAEIESKMYDTEQYSGKICAVRLFLQPSGLVQGAQSEGGDPALCQAAIAAVKVSTFPPVPKELQGQNGIALDFKP